MLSRPRKWAILMGIYAQILFIVSCIGFGFLQGANYSWVKHSISDMYAVDAPHGLVLVALLTVCGAFTILYILLGLWPTLSKAGASAKVGGVLLALSIYGLGDLLSPFERLGCRMADAGCTANAQVATAGGKADQLLSTIGILFFITGIMLVGYSLKNLAGWRKTSSLILLGGYLLIPLFILLGVGPMELGGVIERIIAALGALLLALLAASSYHKLESKTRTA